MAKKLTLTEVYNQYADKVMSVTEVTALSAKIRAKDMTPEQNAFYNDVYIPVFTTTCQGALQDMLQDDDLRQELKKKTKEDVLGIFFSPENTADVYMSVKLNKAIGQKFDSVSKKIMKHAPKGFAVALRQSGLKAIQQAKDYSQDVKFGKIVPVFREDETLLQSAINSLIHRRR